MGRRLATSVHIYDPKAGDYFVYGPGDDVPDKHAKLLEDDWPGWASDEDGDGPPPKGGAGSGADAWAAYAANNGVEVEEGASRDEIVAALEAAQVPTE